MDRFIVCMFLFSLAAFAQATKFTDCGSTSGTVSSVEVTDCPDNQDVCILVKGKAAGITLKFKAKADTNTMTTSVHGVISSVPIPFPIPNPDGCKSGVSCPVKNGESYTYVNKLDIRNSYPSVSVTVRWELKDDGGNDMVCVEIPCKLQ